MNKNNSFGLVSKMFGDTMMENLQGDATSCEYLQDESFVEKLRELQKDSTLIAQFCKDDKRMPIIIRVLQKKIAEQSKIDSAGDQANKTKIPPHMVEEQKKILAKSGIPLKKGDIWYVIPRNWWVAFSHHYGVEPNNPAVTSTKQGGSKPEKINYEAIVKKDPLFTDALQDNLIEHRDYELVHSSLYKDLEDWDYTQELSIPRKVITRGRAGLTTIELYPAFIRVARVDFKGDMIAPVKGCLCANETVYGLMKKIYEQEKTLTTLENEHAKMQEESGKEEMEGKEIPGRVFYLDKKKDKNGCPWKLLKEEQMHEEKDELTFPILVLLLDFKNDGKWCWKRDGIAEHKQFLADLSVDDVIDARDHIGKWYESTILYVEDDLVKVHYNGTKPKWDEAIPKISNRLAKKGKHTSSSFKKTGGSTQSYQSGRTNQEGKPIVQGAVGLRNLGNTCFMNSTLQCLSNTPQLTEFFRSGSYKAEINTTNPLGWKGKVATEYANLINEMWGSKYKTVAPVKFKRVISDFQPRFSGYQQHDSSELLHFLMDGLHEDLNRVMVKPTTEQVDSKGRADAVVAKEAWDRHLKRNQSIIVDLCQGQLKSTVVCPDCGLKSVTFDPYMFLSVPLPQATTKSIEVMYKSLNDGPMVYSVEVPKLANSVNVKIALAKMLGEDIRVASLRMKEIFYHQVYKEYKPLERVQEESEEVWIYEVVDEAKHFQLFHKSTSGRGIKTPTVMNIPPEKLSAMPIDKLRGLIKDCVHPFLTGGWQPTDKDNEMYSIGIYITRTNSSELLSEISYDAETVDFKSFDQEISIGLLWNQDKQDRLREEEWPRHESAKRRGATGKKKTIGLDDCFREFTKKEILAESDAWYCGQCKKHQCAEKKNGFVFITRYFDYSSKTFSLRQIF